MGYRVRVQLDMDFENETDALKLSAPAKILMAMAKELSPLAVSIREGEKNQELGYYSFDLCGHDKGLPCRITDSFTVSKKVI